MSQLSHNLSVNEESKTSSTSSLAIVLSSENGYTSELTGRFFAAVPGEGTFGLLDTGAVLWSASKTLSKWIECPFCGLGQRKKEQSPDPSPSPPRPPASFGVLELGAGYGLPGIVAATLLSSGDKVVLTDVDTVPALSRARESIARNTASADEAARLSVFSLDWGLGDDSKGETPGGGGGGGGGGLHGLEWVDLFIASDCL